MSSLTVEEDKEWIRSDNEELLRRQIPGFTRILEYYPGRQILVEIHENGMYKAVMLRGVRK